MRKNNFSFYDLIGGHLKIIAYSDHSLVGREGTIIYESERTIVIKDKRTFFTIIKANGIYEIDFKGQHITISGEALGGKPVKRLR
ncbi:MAG: ribonuclease P protein subunit [Metallosphaera sp.]|uniref:Ribonuclease P protein component 1 n=1 Tax=Metallosphaera cuprina (strain Ar-4) TaxID=1006006 RepID=F4G1Q4_METCR|nr:ribonuclease P protein subunit [Metallosphaera cuprina]AEB96061.1 ribonuclease P, Rpp29 [Metallosphaera cuprina Ar-4]